MPTSADQRLLELLEKWLKSLELHAKYAGLDTDSYRRVQPWPDHQRPSRWIIDLAAQKAAALKAQVQERIAQGDTKFADSLELMTFLANLIGSEHIERFIPLADAANERPLERSAAAAAQAEAHTGAPADADDDADTQEHAQAPAHRAAARSAEHRAASTGATSVTREMPKFAAAKRPVQKPTAARSAPDSPTATREMPQFAAAKRRAPPPVSTAHITRTERRGAEAAPARPSPRQPAKIAPAESADAAREQVIADAARLVQWGRKWYELAELIARMAGRPPLAEVRRILKDNKTAIEKKAGGG
jgi:hypothetical protein